MSKPIYIGVDPAFRQGGFWAAIIDMADKSVRFQQFRDVLDWYDWLRSDESPDRAFVCIENSNLQNQNFDMTGSRPELARKGRNVGTNQAVSELAYRAACRVDGVTAFQVSPKEKGAKYSPQIFAYMVKSEGLTLPKGQISQDARDAFKLAQIARTKALHGGYFTKKYV